MQYEGVIREIAERNPQISQFQFCCYIAGLNSDTSEYLFPKKVFRVNRDEIRAGFIRCLEARHFDSDDLVIGLTSLVLIEGAKFHLDMIDFGCEKSDEGLAEVRDTLTFLRMKRGFIMDSGNSYHYLSIDFHSEPEFLKLLQRLPSYSSIGSSWPSYQEIKGFSVLRVTPCLRLGKQIPTLIERFENFQTYFPFAE